MMPVILLTVRIWALFWKTSSFLIVPQASNLEFSLSGNGMDHLEGPMSRHSTSFEAESEVPAEQALPAPNSKPDQAVEPVPAPPVPRTGRFRRLLLAGAAVAV